MNLLNGMRCYLSGAMDRIEGGGVQWRITTETWLKDKFSVGVLNPCDKPLQFDIIENDESRKELDDCKAWGDFEACHRLMNPICKVDCRMVDVADFLIVKCDPTIHMAGTYHELVLAEQQHKPVLFVCPFDKIPNWWLGILKPEFFFPNFGTLFEYLEHVDRGGLCDDRWVFWDFEHAAFKH